MIDTFSANSLKILEDSKLEFEKKYIKNLEFTGSSPDIELGNKFHGLICYFLSGFEIKKFEESLTEKEKAVFEKIKNSKIIKEAKNCEEKFVEQPFFVRENLNGTPFYLTGRFDTVIKKGDFYIILDWKTNNLPKNPENNTQTMVYTVCASKFFNTDKIKMVYYSLIKDETKETGYNKEYLNKIKEIVSKIYL